MAPKSEDTQTFSTDEIAQLKNYRPRTRNTNNQPTNSNAVIITALVVGGIAFLVYAVTWTIVMLHYLGR